MNLNKTIKELKNLAWKTTIINAKNFVSSEPAIPGVYRVESTDGLICAIAKYENAEFIAAANPATILLLCTAIEEMRKCIAFYSEDDLSSYAKEVLQKYFGDEK